MHQLVGTISINGDGVSAAHVVARRNMSAGIRSGAKTGRSTMLRSSAAGPFRHVAPARTLC
jgi:hypothetical protein